MRPVKKVCLFSIIQHVQYDDKEMAEIAMIGMIIVNKTTGSTDNYITINERGSRNNR
jgi:hypothetical protein